MTTTVIIKSARPNHNAIKIDLLNDDDTVQQSIDLQDGENHLTHVYSGRRLLITETTKATREFGRQLTESEAMVGLSFNPSADPQVTNCKEEFAAIIQRMLNLRAVTTDSEVKRMASIAITEAQTAQMWAVKALTWSPDRTA